MNQKTRFPGHNRSYAVDSSTIHVTDSGSTAIEALWFKENNGILTVCSGIIFRILAEDKLNIQNFKEGMGSRYGVKTSFTWNGEKVFAPELSFKETMELITKFTPVLENFPLIPNNYDTRFVFDV